jgi:23S rRNA pseudouridine1911/1915/1917 synthase
VIIIEQHTVPNLDSKIRLLDYALKVFSVIPSRSSMKKVIKRGELLVNGKQEPSGTWVTEGQKITLVDKEHKPPKPLDLELEIVYEDEHLAIINKPAGIEVSGNKFYTIQNALVSNFRISAEPDALKWARPVHRLDMPTSGLLLVAKTTSSLMLLGQQFEDKKVKKKYRAIVAGELPQEGEILTPINNQEAFSKFKCLQHCHSLKTSWLSLAELIPHTGRTHQLRIHMAQLGFPIVGDKQYGTDPILRGKGLFLSSVELSFEHPKTNKPVTFSIEHPKKFDLFMKGEESRWQQYYSNTGIVGDKN